MKNVIKIMILIVAGLAIAQTVSAKETSHGRGKSGTHRDTDSSPGV